MPEKITCSICGKETKDVIFKLCPEHRTEFYNWKSRLRLRMDEEQPSGFALLTAFLLYKEQERRDSSA